MSIFRQRIESLAEESVSMNPAVRSGWLVSTDDVLGNELKKNPYFLALNGMCGYEGQALLKLDAIHNGISIAVKDLTTSRNEKVLVNPKFADPKIFGDSTGKLSNLNTQDANVTIGDLAFSGNNNQLATVFGMQITPKKVSISTYSTSKDISDNSSSTDIQGEIQGKLEDGFKPVVPGKDGTTITPEKATFYGQQNEGSNLNPQFGTQAGRDPVRKDVSKALRREHLAPGVDKVTFKTVPAQWNGRGLTGNSLTTGTSLINNTDLTHLAWS